MRTSRSLLTRALRPLALLCLVAVATLLPAQPRPAPSTSTSGSLTIRFLDVGQGDAALVSTPDGRHLLIDAGVGATDVLTQLQGLGVDSLALVVASHNHADHIGGMPAVLTGIPVDRYMDNGLAHTTATYRRTLAAVESRGIRYLRAEPRTLSLGQLQVRVLPTPTDTDEQNDRSVGLVLTWGSFSALFTGDAETHQRDHWRQHGALTPVTLLKVSHHGSHNGTDAPWLRALRPQVAVISSEAGNSYGHPHAPALRALAAAGVTVHRTDLSGTITVTATSDGRYTVTTARRAPAARPSAGPPAPAGRGAQPPTSRRGPVCSSRSQPCGDSCISLDKICRRPPGLARPAGSGR